MTSGGGPRAAHPFVVAHRGASADRPEHTLAAYDIALQQGAEGVECDVRLTRDGHLVCVHDRRVDRTSTGTGLVSDMTLEQLRAFDYGAWHDSWRPDGYARRHRPADARGAGATGARLAATGEAVHRDQASGAVRVSGREQAAGAAAPVRHRVARVGRPVPRRRDVVLGGRRVADQTGRPDAADRAARRHVALPGRKRGDHGRRDAVGPSIDTLREHPELVDRAAAQGRATYCWTVDHLEDVDYCRDLGVGWIATNHPGRTKDWLQRGLSELPRP